MAELLVLLIVITLIVIAYIDFKRKVIPNILNIILLILSVMYKNVSSKSFDHFLGSGIYTLPLIVLYGYVSDFYKKDVMGFGDIKLMISLGMMLWRGTSNIWIHLYKFYFITFLSASFYSILYILLSKKKSREIPLAPFLIIAFFLTWGNYV